MTTTLTDRSPIWGFRPFNPDRVAEIREARSTAWLKAQTIKLTTRKFGGSKAAATPKAIAGISHLSSADQDSVRAALKKMGL